MYKRGDKHIMDFSFLKKRVHRSTGVGDVETALVVEQGVKDKLFDEYLSRKKRPTKKAMLLSDAIERCYKERWQDTKRAPRTKRDAEILLLYMKDKPLDQIDNHDIGELRANLRAKGVKKATEARYMATLKTVMNMAFKEWRVINDVPFIKLPVIKNGRFCVISRELEGTVLNFYKEQGNHEMIDLVTVLIDTGMRLGEAFALSEQDIDYNTMTIHIWENKTDKPRSVPITDRVLTILKRRTQQNRSVFANLTKGQVEWAWTRMRKAIGQSSDPHFVIHALRHTYASRLVMRGISLQRVRDLLGHETIKTTERYAHLAPAAADIRDILNQPDAIM